MCAYFVIVPILIIIALLPWFIYFVYKTRLESKYVDPFMMGAIGWFLAMVARFPLLVFAVLSFGIVVAGIVSAISAGVFEEVFRYYFSKRYIKLPITNGKVISLGLGWGLMEAFMTFCLSLVGLLIIIKFNIDIPWLEEIPTLRELMILGLLGAFERLVTTSLHVGLTIFIIFAQHDKKWLYFAILYHFLVDIMAVIYYVLHFGIYLLEATILAYAVILYFLANLFGRIDIKAFFSDMNAEFRPEI